MYKNISILTLSITLLAACGSNKTEPKAGETKDTVIVVTSPGAKEESKPEEKPAETKEAKKLTMADMVGTWEQNESVQVGGVGVSSSYSVRLMENGNFTKTVSSGAKGNKTGVNTPAIVESGNWTLVGNTVKLGGSTRLEYHDDTKTLVNADKGISLMRK